MITDIGKEIAKTRHRAMVQFLENLSTEIADADEDASEVLGRSGSGNSSKSHSKPTISTQAQYTFIFYSLLL